MPGATALASSVTARVPTGVLRLGRSIDAALSTSVSTSVTDGFHLAPISRS